MELISIVAATSVYAPVPLASDERSGLVDHRATVRTTL